MVPERLSEKRQMSRDKECEENQGAKRGDRVPFLRSDLAGLMQLRMFNDAV